MPIDPHDEIVVSLESLITQAWGGEGSATARIQAAVAAKTFLDALTRRLVNEARDDGTSWEDIALLFGTSAANAKARYGDYNRYDDEG